MSAQATQRSGGSAPGSPPRGTKAPPPSGIEILDRPATPAQKAAYVRDMFDAIAPRYDLLNSLLSAGLHYRWRAFATRCAGLSPGDPVLDVCAGTGAWAAELRHAVGPRGQVVAVDFSRAMLGRGASRFRQADALPLQGDAAGLPLAAGRFAAATVAFGIRNVADVPQAFAEMARVLRPGGRVVCLEFAQPRPGLFRRFYNLYARWVMPQVGGAVSGRSDAYAYLPASVARFHSRDALAALMRQAGLSDVRWVDLMFGLVCVHVGVKPERLESS